ncbi:MAG: hypothetical protein ACI9OD_000885 [Limisphaerales bacterium]
MVVFWKLDSLPFKTAVLFCALSFLIYSVSCLTTARMKLEFERYGLARFRTLTGSLQLLGVAGLLVGIQYPTIGAVTAGGFTVQMLLALGVRLRINDSVIECFPAGAFCALNAGLFAGYLDAVWSN